MKRIPLLVMPLVLLLSCSKELADTHPDERIIPKNNSHLITKETALRCLDVFLDEMYEPTKGITERPAYSEDAISTVSLTTVRPLTKGEEEAEDAELLYIVNFGNNSGYAVLSADDRTDDVVLCVTDSGSIDLSEFAEADAMMNVSTKSDGNADEEVESDFIHDMGEATVPALLLSHIMKARLGDEPQADTLSTKALSTATKYGPYVYTKWGQSTINGVNVFNRFTPHNDPAGCVVIATAQIIMSTKNIYYCSVDGVTTCYRDTMLTVAHYTTPYSRGTENAQVQVGKFVHELGSSAHFCNVTYHSSGTNGTAAGAKRTLENMMYSNVEKRTGFGNSNQKRATNQIREGRPVYLDGCKKNFMIGHAWVLDGEWGDYYHVNWGWDGKSDGYFSKGVFKPADREDDEYDELIDANTHLKQLEPKGPYTWVFRMVTYSL